MAFTLIATLYLSTPGFFTPRGAMEWETVKKVSSKGGPNKAGKASKRWIAVKAIQSGALSIKFWFQPRLIVNASLCRLQPDVAVGENTRQSGAGEPRPCSSPLRLAQPPCCLQEETKAQETGKHRGMSG